MGMIIIVGIICGKNVGPAIIRSIIYFVNGETATTTIIFPLGSHLPTP
jgi:hypothetical protein